MKGHSNADLQGSLKNKRVVILGGSSGIGFATAKAAALVDGQVTIVSANGKRIDNALKELPTGSKGHVADLGNENEIHDLFSELGHFDHLVYTAGENIQIGDLAGVSLQEAHKYFDVRYWGAVAAVKYAAPHINPGGSIVLTSGIASQRPGKGWFLGTSICAAMEGFARAMAVELAPLRVNIVSPGIVRTNLWNSLPEADREQLYQTFADSLLVKRVGEAEDIAKTYLYLMTQQYSTGQTIVVDGGGVLV